LGGILGCPYTVAWDTKRRFVALAAHVIFASGLLIPMQLLTTLNNWNTTFPLMIGNEDTGDRAWKGWVSEFYFTRRAAREHEVRQTIADKTPIPALSNHLIAYYKKSDSNSYRDELGNAPPLEKITPSNSTDTRKSTWFKTLLLPQNLTNDIVKTSQFSLGAIISSESADQSGPARIISLSADTGRRNFTLGQDGPDLIFRLRTPMTGENGVGPSLRVPSVFSTAKVRHIVITYDGTNLHVYVDGQRRPESLRLTPALSFYNSVREVDFPSSQLAHLIYYGIIFVPIGMMLLLAIGEANFNRDLRVFFLFGGLMSLLFSVVLEGLLMLFSGRQAQVDNVLVGVFFCYCSFIGLYCLLIKKLLPPILLIDILPEGKSRRAAIFARRLNN
jgi:hypothetical protein